MAIAVLDPDKTSLVKGRYYAWIRTDRSRAIPHARVPMDTFLEYSVTRCSLPSADHRFVKAISKTKFEVRDDFQEIPDDRLHAGGLQAKFDNGTDVISDEQMIAEEIYRKEALGVRADVHSTPGPVRAAQAAADIRDGVESPVEDKLPQVPGLDAASAEAAAAAVAEAGAGVDGADALQRALSGGTGEAAA